MLPVASHEAADPLDAGHLVASVLLDGGDYVASPLGAPLQVQRDALRKCTRDEITSRRQQIQSRRVRVRLGDVAEQRRPLLGDVGLG